MDCRNIKRRINLYIDDRLDPEEKSSFEIHMKQCTTCARELAEASAIVTATRGITPEEVPATFSADLRIKLAEVNRDNAARSSGFFRRPVFKALAASAAALLVIFIAGGIIKNNPGLFNGSASMNAAMEDAAQPGNDLKSSEETFAVAAFGVARTFANTVITVTTDKPQEQFAGFKIFAEGYGAALLDPDTATDSAETAEAQIVSAGSAFTVPKDVYGIIVDYLQENYPAVNISLQEISLPGDSESSIVIDITFTN